MELVDIMLSEIRQAQNQIRFPVPHPQKKTGTEKQVWYALSHMWKLKYMDMNVEWLLLELEEGRGQGDWITGTKTQIEGVRSGVQHNGMTGVHNNLFCILLSTRRGVVRLSMVVPACNPSFRRLKQEDGHKVKASLGYTVSSSPDWATLQDHGPKTT